MMQSVRKPSVVPIYTIAAVWLIYTLATGLHRLLDVAICAALSVGGYFLMRTFFPGTTVQVEVPEPEPDTGDRELDEVIRQGRASIAAIRRLNEQIPDDDISKNLSALEDLTRKIFARLEADKQHLPRCRQFLNYYLPTTIELLERYVTLQNQGLDTGDVREAMGRIARMLYTIREAFTRQLDSLFAQDVVDINAEITVMEQMMQAQGLRDTKDFTTKE
ncbi:MAG TPA: 5-bromo-4-chloroindolyl phosphate hydrolysis family protein [Candidatus Avoscillospira avistercoris]|uniref:5-bromo-4-chloroindolyl phosphate hydrolysis family protein n=1 Tax=Candidatus Avoscillospira avistercoris TaxID=2840707 RepID=A0A9D1FB72_9FIRM|nr:5-bromo-4-chloroindolyl phosphate hydrolysis family protein [Candidatus Avoscillospira avistercoris]